MKQCGIRANDFILCKKYLILHHCSILVGGSSDYLAGSPPGTGSSDDCVQTATLSFAQMLRAGKAKPQEMMGKAAAAAASPCESKSAPKGSDSETDDEDRIPVPVYQASFGDAIQQALDKYKTPGLCISFVIFILFVILPSYFSSEVNLDI